MIWISCSAFVCATTRGLEDEFPVYCGCLVAGIRDSHLFILCLHLCCPYRQLWLGTSRLKTGGRDYTSRVIACGLTIESTSRVRIRYTRYLKGLGLCQAGRLPLTTALPTGQHCPDLGSCRALLRLHLDDATLCHLMIMITDALIWRHGILNLQTRLHLEHGHTRPSCPSLSALSVPSVESILQQQQKQKQRLRGSVSAPQ